MKGLKPGALEPAFVEQHLPLMCVVTKDQFTFREPVAAANVLNTRNEPPANLSLEDRYKEAPRGRGKNRKVRLQIYSLMAFR